MHGCRQQAVGRNAAKVKFAVIFCAVFNRNSPNSQAIAVQLPLDPQFITTLLDPHVGGTLYERMRNLYHISIAISPLFALQPRRFHHENHGRHLLLAVSRLSVLLSITDSEVHFQTAFSLGNERPAFLRSTERAIWTALVNILGGSSAMVELEKFLSHYEDLEHEYDGTDCQANWFAQESKFKSLKHHKLV
jgi:hypothetical protein